MLGVLDRIQRLKMSKTIKWYSRYFAKKYIDYREDE